MLFRVSGVRSLFVVAPLLAAGCVSVPPRDVADRDRDGLDDRLEAQLANAHLPIIHEFADGAEEDNCLEPRARPILYRARPRVVADGLDRNEVAITYVLLYAADCGGFGHPFDHEPFTVFLRRIGDTWQTVAALAVAHQGELNEQRSAGAGREIWVSRNKHANFATFDACGDNDLSLDVCAADGPQPRGHTLLNAGEPWARLTNDLGDAHQLFRGRRIWDHSPPGGGGNLTAQLFITVTRSEIPAFEWGPEQERMPRR